MQRILTIVPLDAQQRDTNHRKRGLVVNFSYEFYRLPLPTIYHELIHVFRRICSGYFAVKDGARRSETILLDIDNQATIMEMIAFKL
jgi:hypothetical protein